MSVLSRVSSTFFLRRISIFALSSLLWASSLMATRKTTDCVSLPSSFHKRLPGGASRRRDCRRQRDLEELARLIAGRFTEIR
jgi:hypothetical protein